MSGLSRGRFCREPFGSGLQLCVFISLSDVFNTTHVSDLRFVSSIEKLLLFLPMTYTDMSFELVCNNQNLLSE